MAAPKIVLPTARSKPAPNLSKMKSFIYGPAKIGKSQFCASIPNAIFLPTEKGLDNIACYKVEDPYPIDTWDGLKAALNAIVESGKWESLIIDTADNAYRLCCEAVCGKKKWEHLEDPGYGKGYSYADMEFETFLRKLTYLDMGIWLTSHATQREIESRTGNYKKWSPTLRDSPNAANAPRKVVLGWAEVILFADMERVGENGQIKRVIRTKPSLTHEGGDRTRLLPDTIPLDWDEFAKYFRKGAKTAPATVAEAETVNTEIKE